MKASLYLAAGLAALAAPAGAVTIDLTTSFNVAAGSPSVYVIDNDFTLPAGFSNAVLNITRLSIDDRGVVQLNGVDVDNAGIFGPGDGFLTRTPGGTNDPFTYTRGNGARDVTITSGFVAGLNSFRFLVNDTNNGIFGAPLASVNISGGGIVATLTYDAAPAIPEPATWAMMIGGFGMLGAAARNRTALAQRSKAWR
jgi:hypothetical protein